MYYLILIILVLVTTALESIGIGWIYGMKRFNQDLKLMKGTYPNIYWRICIGIVTPVLTIVSLS